MTTAAAIPIFQYGTTPRPRRRWWTLSRLVLSLPALVVPFLDFHCGVSPMEATAAIVDQQGSDGAWLTAALGAGFFVGFIVIAWRAVLLVRPDPGPRATRLGAAAALLAWLPYAATSVLWPVLLIRNLWDAEEPRPTLDDSLPFLAAATVACAGLLLAWRLLTAGDRPAALAAAMTAPFLANAVLCLTCCYDPSPQIGYYVTAYLVLFWSADLSADALRLARRRLRCRRWKQGN